MRYLVAAILVLATSLVYAASAQGWRRLSELAVNDQDVRVCRDGVRFQVGTNFPTALTLVAISPPPASGPPPPESIVARQTLTLEPHRIDFLIGNFPDFVSFSGTFAVSWVRPLEPQQVVLLGVYQPSPDAPEPDGFFLGVIGAPVQDCLLKPTSKEQCKNGGWRNFPGFNNEGRCVSFVATGGKKQT